MQVGKDINKAVELLNRNQVIGLPTETVYGLAANAFVDEAVLRIFEVKNRPTFNPLIIHTDSIEKIQSFVNGLPEKARLLGEAFWPGPLTMLLPKSKRVGDLVTSGSPLVAVRIPENQLALELLSRLEYPLAAPSANKFGSISPTVPEAVIAQLGKDVPYVLDGGACDVGIESTIIGFESDVPVVYRTGGLELEEIERIIGRIEVNKKSHEKPLTSGMLKSHYSPETPFYVGNIKEGLAKYKGKKIGVLSFLDIYQGEHVINYRLSTGGGLREATKNLFNYMRLIDEEDVEVILAEYVPNEGLGRGVNDRLKRADHFNK